MQIGTAKGAKSVFPHLAQSQDQRKTASALELCAQLEFQSTVDPELDPELGTLNDSFTATACQFLAGKVLSGCMASATLNVSLSKEQLALVNREVDSGQYISAGEVVREALREWLNRRIEADVAALEKNHKGAWERDTTPEEEALILAAKREARADLLARNKKTRK